MKVDYDDRQHVTYAAGRAFNVQTRELWASVIERFIPAGRDVRVLDLGCGTGRFALLLAECTGGRIVGIEPSQKMLEQAMRDSAHPHIEYVAGKAERIPLPNATLNAAFLSMVVHHFDDLAAAARELHRVLMPGSPVLIRNCFSGRLDAAECYKWFPEAKAIDDNRMPTLEKTRDTFIAAGFEWLTSETVHQEIDPHLMAHYERLSWRSVSTFDLLPDDVVDAGLERMRRVAEQEANPQPVTEDIDVLTMRRGE